MRTLTASIAASAVLALVLAIGAGVAPASAIGGPVITVKGHVYDENGKPVSGILATSTCGCGFEGGTPPAFIAGSDRTSKTGYFSYRVLQSSARYVSFEDPKKRYILTSVHHFAKKDGALVAKKTLQLASQISGTIRDEIGRPVRGGQIHVFDAVTGKTFRIADNSTDKNGQFHAIVPGGTYKVRFSGINDTYAAEWYGDATTRAASPSVTVPRGGKVTGINATVRKELRIQGSVKLTDKKHLYERGDRVKLTAVAADGTVAYDGFADNYFFLNDLPAGTYSLNFTPVGSNFFTPKTVSVVLPPNEDMNDVDVTLDYIPAASDNKRSAVFSWSGGQRTGVKGEVFTTTFRVFSNGSITGGIATFYADGQKLGSAPVSASGKTTLRTRFAGVTVGSHKITAEFSGTSTVLPSSEKTFTVKVKK